MFDEESPVESASDEELVAAVEGDAADGGRMRAIKELGRRRSPLGARTLTRVVSEVSEPENLRAAAAVGLGQQDSAASRAALVTALGTTENAVTRHAAEALGRVGDVEAMRALSSATESLTEGPARRSAEFAQSLIAYRFGMDGHRIERPGEDDLLDPDLENTQPVTVRTPGAETFGRAIADLDRELPSLTPSPTGALGLTCGSSEYVVVLNGDLGGDALQRLQNAPAMPAVVLKLSGGLDRFFLHAYLLTQPVGPGDLELFLTRTTGDTALFGGARIEDGHAAFTLRATATPYPPNANLEGTFDGSRVEINSARAVIQGQTGPAERGARSPRKIDVFAF